MVKKKVKLSRLLSLAFIISTICALGLGLAFVLHIYQNVRDDSAMAEMAEMDERMEDRLSAWLWDMVNLSDTVYYDVLEDVDYSDHDLTRGINLLYSANTDYIEDIVLFTEDGEKILSLPELTVKDEEIVTEEVWFANSINDGDTIRFYMPGIQHLFDSDTYTWTIPMTRPVLLTCQGKLQKGLLLIDLKYTALASLMESYIGENGQTIFILDQDGNIVFHPNRSLMTASEEEACKAMTSLESGQQKLDGCYISVEDIGYVGWRIITTQKAGNGFTVTGKNISFLLLIIMILISFVFILNYFSGHVVVRPFRHLEKSLTQVEEGNMDITYRGSYIYEVDHLDKSITTMAGRLKALLTQINEEAEAKRKIEMDALLAQINPHFLYNTLEAIVWLLEEEDTKNARKMVTTLAKYFRISLNKGKQTLSLQDEMDNTENYLYLQSMRFEFGYELDMQEDTKNLEVVKMLLQPLVENAIYHGIAHMSDEGEIYVGARREGDDLYLIVQDNGCGITPERMDKMLKGQVKSSKNHSGIGVANIIERIHLYYGEAYGVEIESEIDEGTKFTLHLPAVERREEEKS